MNASIKRPGQPAPLRAVSGDSKISLRELTISVGALDLLLSELEEHEKTGR